MRFYDEMKMRATLEKQYILAGEEWSGQLSDPTEIYLSPLLHDFVAAKKLKFQTEEDDMGNPTECLEIKVNQELEGYTFYLDPLHLSRTIYYVDPQSETHYPTLAKEIAALLI